MNDKAMNDVDLLIAINRMIGPRGEIVLASKTKAERRDFGRYYRYDYRQDAVWVTHVDLSEFWLELVARYNYRPSLEDRMAAAKGDDEKAEILRQVLEEAEPLDLERKRYD